MSPWNTKDLDVKHETSQFMRRDVSPLENDRLCRFRSTLIIDIDWTKPVAYKDRIRLLIPERQTFLTVKEESFSSGVFRNSSSKDQHIPLLLYSLGLILMTSVSLIDESREEFLLEQGSTSLTSVVCRRSRVGEVTDRVDVSQWTSL